MGKRCMYVCLIAIVGLVFVGCPTPALTYEIGEYGPGGGIVFYDKGSVSDGWRYLEVASMDAGSLSRWGKTTHVLTGAAAGIIGTGDENTATIVSAYGVDTYAARICAEDISGGCDDWYLPSQDELLEIHTNLKLSDIGNLKDGFYWSSTENDLSTAIAVDFSDAAPVPEVLNKNNGCAVRPVRAF